MQGGISFVLVSFLSPDSVGLLMKHHKRFKNWLTLTNPKQIETHEYKGNPKKPDGLNHWVTCISGRGSQAAIVAGPYPTHAKAEAAVDRAQFLAEQKFAYTTDLAFAGWGTGSTKRAVKIPPKISAEEMERS